MGYLPTVTVLLLDTPINWRSPVSNSFCEHGVISPLPVVNIILKSFELSKALNTLMCTIYVCGVYVCVCVCTSKFVKASNSYSMVAIDNHKGAARRQGQGHGYRSQIPWGYHMLQVLYILTDRSACARILYVTMTTVSYKTWEISVIFLSEYLSYTLAVTYMI